MDEESLAKFDRLIIATLGERDALIADLVRQGVDPDGLVTLRPTSNGESRRGARH